MKLDLPGRVPLPDDVRHRALDTVLAAIDEPADRPRTGWTAIIAAAAAAVAVVVAATTLAPDREPEAPPAPPLTSPAQGGPTVAGSRDAFDRCAAAADAQPGAYAPSRTWTTGEETRFGADSVVVIDDRYACLVTPVSVTVAPAVGVAVGDATLVRVAPQVLAVLNPAGLPVGTGATTRRPGLVRDPVVLLTTDAPDSLDLRLTVGEEVFRPVPDPPAGRRVVDRPPAPDAGPDEEVDLADVGSCLASQRPIRPVEPEVWRPSVRDGSGPEPVLVMRVGDDLAAGICVLGPDGPLLSASRIDREPAGAAQQPRIVAVGGDPDWYRAVVLVPPGATRVQVVGTTGDGEAVVIDCGVADGLALCQGPVTEARDVRAFDDGSVDPSR